MALEARTLHPDARIAGSLAAVADGIRTTGGTCLVVQADLTRDEDLERIVRETVAGLGAPSILVNNAAAAMALVTRSSGALATPWRSNLARYCARVALELFVTNTTRAPSERRRSTA